MMASCLSPAKEAEVESATKPNWLELPRDLTVNILSRLGTVDIVTSACVVCPLWWNICKDPLMWRAIDISDVNLLKVDSSHLVNICRYAVDLSRGHLEEIDIEYGNDDILQYIADRASHLRRIQLSDCQLWPLYYRISDKGLSEAAKKLPLLEELNISLNNLSKDSLEVIGRYCPLLKSLKIFQMILEAIKSNEVVFSIAKTMPGLCHLNIYGGIVITNDGLLAILDGCSLLESLDVRECFDLDLSGSVEKRCHDQIRDLHLPYNKVDGSFLTMMVHGLAYIDPF